MISRKELASYINRGWTAVEIAEVCNCSKGTVRRKAKEHGLSLRRTREPKKVLELYRRLGTIRAVGEALGITGSAVSQILRTHFPGYAGSKAGLRYTEEERSRAMGMYIDGAEIDDICAEIGCGRSTVTGWAAEDGIGRGNGRRRSFDVKEAAELYERFGTLKAAAEVLGVSETSVWRALREVR